MISFLAGKILNKGQGYLIVRIGDIGYKVFVSSDMYAGAGLGEQIEIYTYQYVREDSLDLYGFKNLEELEMYEMLLSISGIGPKSALGVLSVADVPDIKDSISQSDPSLLTKVSGIGRKTAERVILELREKISKSFVLDKQGQAKKGQAKVSGYEIDALMSLGYSMTQAREALRRVDPKIKDSGERIKEALKGLGK